MKYKLEADCYDLYVKEVTPMKLDERYNQFEESLKASLREFIED